MEEIFGRMTGMAFEPSVLMGLPSAVEKLLPSAFLSNVYSGLPAILEPYQLDTSMNKFNVNRLKFHFLSILTSLELNGSSLNVLYCELSSCPTPWVR